MNDRSPMLSDPPLPVSCAFLLVLALPVDVWVGEGAGVRPNMGGFCANAAPAGQIKITAARVVAAALPFIKNLWDSRAPYLLDVISLPAASSSSIAITPLFSSSPVGTLDPLRDIHVAVISLVDLLHTGD